MRELRGGWVAKRKRMVRNRWGGGGGVTQTNYFLCFHYKGVTSPNEDV